MFEYFIFNQFCLQIVAATDLYWLLAEPSARWRHFFEIGVRVLRFSRKRQHETSPKFSRGSRANAFSIQTALKNAAMSLQRGSKP